MIKICSRKYLQSQFGPYNDADFARSLQRAYQNGKEFATGPKEALNVLDRALSSLLDSRIARGWNNNMSQKCIICNHPLNNRGIERKYKGYTISLCENDARRFDQEIEGNPNKPAKPNNPIQSTKPPGPTQPAPPVNQQNTTNQPNNAVPAIEGI